MNIDEQLKLIEKSIKDIHPDNPFILEMQRKYRELKRKQNDNNRNY